MNGCQPGDNELIDGQISQEPQRRVVGCNLPTEYFIPCPFQFRGRQEVQAEGNQAPQQPGQSKPQRSFGCS